MTRVRAYAALAMTLIVIVSAVGMASAITSSDHDLDTYTLSDPNNNINPINSSAFDVVDAGADNDFRYFKDTDLNDQSGVKTVSFNFKVTGTGSTGRWQMGVASDSFGANLYGFQIENTAIYLVEDGVRNGNKQGHGLSQGTQYFAELIYDYEADIMYLFIWYSQSKDRLHFAETANMSGESFSVTTAADGNDGTNSGTLDLEIRNYHMADGGDRTYGQPNPMGNFTGKGSNMLRVITTGSDSFNVVDAQPTDDTKFYTNTELSGNEIKPQGLEYRVTFNFNVTQVSDSGEMSFGWSDELGLRNDIKFLGFALDGDPGSANDIELHNGTDTLIIGSFNAQTDQKYVELIVDPVDENINLTVWESQDKSVIYAEGGMSYNSSVDWNHFYGVVSNGGINTGELDVSITNYSTNFVERTPGIEGNITLEVNPWMAHGSTQPYQVFLDNGTEVTDDADVESSNTSVITVDLAANQLEATSDISVNRKVNITASYEGESDRQAVTVGNRTLENIGIMPPTQWAASFLCFDGGSWYIFGCETQWLLLAIWFGASLGGLARNRYVGIGGITGFVLIFWILGFVSFGMALVTLFVSIFMVTMIMEIPTGSRTSVEVDMNEG